MSSCLHRLRFALVASLALVVALLLPAVARAQITVAQATSLPRTDATGKEVKKRDQRFKPEGISFQDCVDDLHIRFSLTMATPEANASLQAWATTGGTDCSAQTARTGNSAVCWRVLKGIPLSVNPIFLLPMRKIIGGRNNGKDPTKDPEEGKDGIDICGTIDLTTISLQFLYFRPGDVAQAAFKADVPVIADTIGPVAPTGLQILPGNTRLQISFNALGEGGVVELSQVRAYCDPSPGASTTPTTTRVCDSGTSDADADPDADTGVVDPDAGCVDVPVEGGTTTGGEACSSAAFNPTDGGKIQPDNAFNALYECASLPVSSTGSSLVARELRGAPLENGHTYAVALAATDSFLNVGPLSEVVCNYPEETADFWTDYKEGGGRAGGGFCSVDGAGLPVGSFTVIALASLFGAATVRRWRKRR